MTEQTTEKSHLSGQQLARVEALHEARKALVHSTFGGAKVADALDLMRVARFIETGNDDLMDIIDE